jgi:hypothetical protein
VRRLPGGTVYGDAVVALDRKAETAAKIMVMQPPFIWPCNRPKQD